MPVTPGSPQLVMHRPTLDGLPPLAVPAGYRARHFESGDEAAWVAVVDHAFHDGPHEPAWFYERLADLPFEARRVWFIVDDSGPVATASAWHRAKWGAQTGYLHMVGALEAHRGRGLGYQVSLAALWEMVRDGRREAVLETDDFRAPAIRAYLALGFQPRLVHDNQRERWRTILAEIKRDPAPFSDLLEGPVHLPLEPPASD